MNPIFSTIIIPQPEGAFLVKPGKPMGITAEVPVKQFARAVKLSVRRVLALCEEGKIKSRPISPSPRSKRVIPASEIERFLNLE